MREKRILYIGCKVIKGERMSLNTFNFMKGKPEVKPDQEGYLVEYEDGYESWSPKETFERAYRKLGKGEIDLLFGYNVTEE